MTPLTGPDVGEPVNVLLVEDSEDDAALILMALAAGGLRPNATRVETEAALRGALNAQSWDVVLADHSLPMFSAVQALSVVRHVAGDIPFIVVSGILVDEEAVALMRAGANDYVLKGNMARLSAAVRREIAEALERRKRLEAERRIEYLALHDETTGLPNRVSLIRAADEMIATGGGYGLIGIAVELTRLDEAIDAFGRAYGDAIVQRVSAGIRQALPESTVAARIGPSRLAILLRASDAPSDLAGLTRIAVSAASGTISVLGAEVSVGMYAGLAGYSLHATDGAGLLRCAEVALREAVRTQTPGVVYSEELGVATIRRINLLGELEHGLANGELTAAYQPKIDLHTGQIMGVEALIRWPHPRLGTIPPDNFIPLAEQAGLIHHVTRYMMDIVLAQIALWKRQGLTFPVAMNLSTRDLEVVDFASEVVDAAGKHDLRPSDIGLEITECSAVTDRASAITSLGNLADLGVFLSLDDFGTGFSALADIREFPVHEVKIDQSFVRSAMDNSRDRTILEAVYALASDLDLSVVAEGIEDAETASLVSSLGPVAGQGYWFCRPLPPDALEHWLAGQQFR